MKELSKKQILGSDGETLVLVYDGDVDYVTNGKSLNYKYYYDNNRKRFKTRPYTQWSAMTNRCLKGGTHQDIFESYKGTIVSDEFLDFDAWVDWSQQQVGFMCVDNSGNLFQQDKDLLGDGNLYGKDTCCFISPELNNLLRVFETEVKGVRATSQGTYQYVYNGRTYGVPTKEEAVYYAYKRDKEKLLNYVHDNFDILCETVIKGILNKLDELKEREFTQEKEQMKAKAEYDEYARFVKDYSAFKTEKPNRDGLPDGIVFKRSLNGGYVVRINFRGRSMLKNHRAHFDTLSEAELFLLEKKLEVMGIIENDYFFNKRVVEKYGAEFVSRKNFYKDQNTMLLSGMF